MAGTREKFSSGRAMDPGRVVRLRVRTRPEQAAGTTESWMTQCLISFAAQAMDHIPGEDMPAVARAGHAAV